PMESIPLGSCRLGRFGAWALAAAFLAGSSCALLPPTGAVALPAPQKRPEGPGERVLRNSDGQVVQTVQYWVDARGHETRNGVEETFWPDGSLKAHREFAHGTPMGHWVTYWPDGQVRSDHRLDPEQATPMVFFYSTGAKSAEGKAVAGRREGEWTYWHPSGQVSEQGSYERGQRQGLWSFHDENGAITQVRFDGGARVPL
ncbi:MAG: hypothetical protein KDB61_03725, partial [Planctomycetes bacterium]|nr:hypothetical protein [Planctomycetota bacterium]